MQGGLTAVSLLMMALQAYFAARVVNVVQRHGVHVPNQLSASCEKHPLGEGSCRLWAFLWWWFVLIYFFK